jgi:uncharacterized glyoxalase superfamily protein PhnB
MPDDPVIPVLVYDDVEEATDWLSTAFGFPVRWRAGSHRAQLAVGNGAIVVAQREARRRQPGTLLEIELRQPRRDEITHTVMVRVDDVDAHHRQAVEAGAPVLEPPTDHPYGERQYVVEDLAGRRWTFTQTIADVAPEDWGATTPG